MEKINKKGIVWFVPVIIAGIVLLLVGGGLTALKINKLTSQIPTWVWYLIIFIIILALLRRKK